MKNRLCATSFMVTELAQETGSSKLLSPSMTVGLEVRSWTNVGLCVCAGLFGFFNERVLCLVMIIVNTLTISSQA